VTLTSPAPRTIGPALLALGLATALAVPAGAPAADGPRGGAAERPREAAAWMDEAYRLRAAGNLDGAVLALESARSAGYDGQRVALELAYVEVERKDARRAREHFGAAARGPDGELAARARAELLEGWLTEAAALRERGDAAGAERALDEAALLAPGSERIALERGYTAAALGRADDAREQFRIASAGSGPIARQASAELQAMRPPSAVRLDLYFETFAWNRVEGADLTKDAVPMIRMRLLRRPWAGAPFEVYAFLQATRDLASRPATAAAGPMILADNAALAGGGLLLAPYRWLGLYAQVGASTSLLEAGAGVELDARAGAYSGLESGRCAPSPGGIRLGLVPCAELWAEATWLSRFGGDVVGVARGRGGATWLSTGPLAWQLVGEVRAGADRNRDYWANFAEAGAGHRWRLVRPFRLDLLLSANAGRFLGPSGRDPIPADRTYTDLRLELATEIVR
jgi:tetratricopeptide (TPR) repeat protein